MHLAGTTYEEIYRTFRWELPERFNIAEAVVTRRARANPDAPALIHDRDGAVETWSFARVEEAACRLANALAALGVVPRTLVAIHLPQCPETLIAHLAVQKLGAIGLPLFVLFGPDAIEYRLRDSAARVLITTAEAHERHEDVLRGIETLAYVLTVVANVCDPPHPAAPLAGGRERRTGGEARPGVKRDDFWGLCERAASHHAAADTSAGDPALLMYTSGTTGNPKGVLHAQRVLLGHLPGVVIPHDLFPQPGDRFWTPADWAWAGGLLDVLLPSLYFGVPVVASARGKFDPERAMALMARQGVRNVFMPPTALRMMRQAPRSSERCWLRSLATGGEKLGADMIDWGRETLGVTINEFYGQTEVNLVCGNAGALFPVEPGSMGRAIPGHAVEVVDADGTVLRAGTPGVVAVERPDPVMFLEYWSRPEATAEKFRGDWCLLGDVAVKDERGYFWFQGRDDDIISSAGYRIGPGEVEGCLAKHPAVALAGVVGAPDPVRGEVVAAFVVPREGFIGTPELAAELQEFVKRRLAAHEYPRIVRFIAEMPVTVTGKIRRTELRKIAAAAGPD